MKLNELSAPLGAKKRKRRVGRGPSSGHGQSSGRGFNGQKCRSGVSIHETFEGGQTPYFRRIPKRGFSNFVFKENYSIVNLAVLNEKFNDGDKIGKQDLLDRKIIRNKKNKLKILGDGDLEKALHLVADKFSKSAKLKIEKAKGSCKEA